jgi:hypothetical protein
MRRARRRPPGTSCAYFAEVGHQVRTISDTRFADVGHRRPSGDSRGAAAVAGPAYWLDVPGHHGWQAHYLKEVDTDENTVRFWQEIYDDTGKLVEAIATR